MATAYGMAATASGDRNNTAGNPAGTATGNTATGHPATADKGSTDCATSTSGDTSREIPAGHACATGHSDGNRDTASIRRRPADNRAE